MNNDIFKKFSPNLKKALVEAERMAKEKGVPLNTDHQLLALLRNKETLAYEILSSFDITEDRVMVIASLINPDKPTPGLISEDARKSIQLAVQFASKYKHLTIGSEHLLLALVSNKSFNAYVILERTGSDPKKIKKQIETIFSGISDTFTETKDQPTIESMSMDDNNFSGDSDFMPGGGIPPFVQQQTRTKKESALESFSTNLTKLAERKKLDVVIGREKEIARVIQTLSRRTKNNPILVGEPGVGKTSIVEGLAQRIVSQDVPESLMNAEILSIDLGSILAGTMYRGQFESRIKKILAEIEKAGNIILFVDEIHMMVGAGSTEGSIDAANLLKPMLAKGTLRMIGSTTFDEYKKHIEKDPAFERRFQPIQVAEPTIEETIPILKGIKNHYEKFHSVIYDDSAIKAAAELSKRYINDRFLPDKAIDLIDEAGAAISARKNSDPTGELKSELISINKRKETAILAERFAEAAMLREKELILESKIRALSTTVKRIPVTISEGDIAKLVSEWTGVPTIKLSSKEKMLYANLEKTLKKFVIGQDEAVSEVAAAIKRSRVGISSPTKPIGSFIFLGPTGVGKTELAKVMAREIFGSESALIKIDMSEFMERHNMSQLIGAPAGYVGYEEGGKLTERVRHNPYSVILFDEIEKAHPEIFNILLQIMDEGVLTDAKGRKVDFKNTIIVMTSNLGSDLLRHQSVIGFNKAGNVSERIAKLKENVLESVEKTFRPEFINRLDKVVVFSPLDNEAIKKIVVLQLADLEQRLKKQGYKIEVKNDVIDWIAKNSFNPEFGARPIKKTIAEKIEAPITEKILRDKYKEGDTINVELKNDAISLA
ncbi:MAG TPA: ATP-dependent Clp protease ATP-binding subunit [bacterium]|nr:ATP-dependent Clp protease ATP-binding subunit [bacterium]